jgi:hypothetical protein
VRWCQPVSQARAGASATGPAARSSTVWAAVQVAAGIRVQAAARRSRTGGQPRSHAAPYPTAAVAVTGHAATAMARSRSQPVSLAILRTSQRNTAILTSDQMLTGPAPG